MIAYGGATFASALVRTSLIDEYYFIINPAILGKGVSIFTKMDDILLLTPVSAKVYPCGITVLGLPAKIVRALTFPQVLFQMKGLGDTKYSD